MTELILSYSINKLGPWSILQWRRFFGPACSSSDSYFEPIEILTCISRKSCQNRKHFHNAAFGCDGITENSQDLPGSRSGFGSILSSVTPCSQESYVTVLDEILFVFHISQKRIGHEKVYTSQWLQGAVTKCTRSVFTHWSDFPNGGLPARDWRLVADACLRICIYYLNDI